MKTTLAVRRRAFTLVEMLVVMTIMLILIGLTAGLSPRILDRKKITRGTDQVANALLVAKQYAKRYKLPTGLRLKKASAADTSVTTLEFVQQPEDFTGGWLEAEEGKALALPTTVNFSGVDFTAYNNVQPGDYLEVNGGGLLHRIASVPAATQLVLDIAPDQVSYISRRTQAYRIIRRARVLPGEPAVSLVDGIGIDLYPGTSVNVPADLGGNLDILFSPAGNVISAGAGKATVILWVRDLALPDKFLGQPTLVCVYTRTGFIAVHPPAPPPDDPYTFTRDGRGSGM